MVIWTYGKGPLSKRDETCCHHYMGCSLIRKDILYAPSHKEEGNVLFNNALNTFYLRLCGVTHMVKNHSDRKKGNPLLPHGLLFPISSKHHPRQVNTYHSLCYTSHGSLAGTRNSSKGSPWRIDPTTLHTMSKRYYHGATSCPHPTRIRIAHTTSSFTLVVKH